MFAAPLLAVSVATTIRAFLMLVPLAPLSVKNDNSVLLFTLEAAVAVVTVVAAAAIMLQQCHVMLPKLYCI